MLSDLANIPIWALVLLGVFALAFIALLWAAVRASAYYSRLEEEAEEDARRFNTDNARAFARGRK